MGDNRNLENVKAWISDEAHMQMCLGYGQNEQSVNDALNDQRRRTRMISDYKREVDGAVKNESKDTAAEVEGSYESLSTVSKRRLGCLQDVSKVAGLEALCSELSSNVDDCAYSLVSGEAAAAGDGGFSGQDGDGVARAAQNCIFAFRNNWRWIKTMMQCVDIHLENASAYQQFFHEVKESTQWMSATMKKFEHMFESRDLTGTKPEAQTELANIKEVLRLFVQWQSKVNLIFETAKTIVPVNMRREPLEDPWPIRALADYKTKEIEINEGEDLTLLDTSQKTRWRVKNLVNQEALVPAPICLIPPTAPEALEAATNLRFVLLALWTTAVKNIGKQLIFLMQHVFKDFSGNEKNNLKSMTPKQAEEMRRIMKYIQGSLGKVWHGYSEYDTLNSRMDRLCDFVGSNGKEAADPAFINLLMATAGLMEKNQLKYDELFKFWETFKLLLESSRHPRAMLICDKWEQLKFTDIDDILKFWRSDLGLEEGKDDTDASNAKVTQMTEADEDKIRNEATTTEEEPQEIFEAETIPAPSAQSTEIVTAEQQEKKTFVITGVIDPRNGEEISMQQAVMLGILNQKQGIYVNPDTGETMPFPVAMNSGKIKVGVVSTEKGEEKKSSFGVVTIRTTKESRPYTVTSVLDPETRKEMSLDQAVERGILSETTGVYKDPKTGKEMTLQKAIDAGLLKVEYDNSAPEQGEQTSTKTWAIHSVVDQQEKKKGIDKGGTTDPPGGTHSPDDVDVRMIQPREPLSDLPSEEQEHGKSTGNDDLGDGNADNIKDKDNRFGDESSHGNDDTDDEQDEYNHGDGDFEQAQGSENIENQQEKGGNGNIYKKDRGTFESSTDCFHITTRLESSSSEVTSHTEYSTETDESQAKISGSIIEDSYQSELNNNNNITDDTKSTTEQHDSVSMNERLSKTIEHHHKATMTEVNESRLKRTSDSTTMTTEDNMIVTTDQSVSTESVEQVEVGTSVDGLFVLVERGSETDVLSTESTGRQIESGLVGNNSADATVVSSTNLLVSTSSNSSTFTTSSTEVTMVSDINEVRSMEGRHTQVDRGQDATVSPSPETHTQTGTKEYGINDSDTFASMLYGTGIQSESLTEKMWHSSSRNDDSKNMEEKTTDTEGLRSTVNSGSNTNTVVFSTSQTQTQIKRRVKATETSGLVSLRENSSNTNVTRLTFSGTQTDDEKLSSSACCEVQTELSLLDMLALFRERHAAGLAGTSTSTVLNSDRVALLASGASTASSVTGFAVEGGIHSNESVNGSSGRSSMAKDGSTAGETSIQASYKETTVAFGNDVEAIGEAGHTHLREKQSSATSTHSTGGKTKGRRGAALKVSSQSTDSSLIMVGSTGGSGEIGGAQLHQERDSRGEVSLGAGSEEYRARWQTDEMKVRARGTIRGTGLAEQEGLFVSNMEQKILEGDKSSQSCCSCSFCWRVWKICLPLWLLLLLLLALIFIGFNNECSPRFDLSFRPKLRYVNGPPPI